jgi:hypothetical protein
VPPGGIKSSRVFPSTNSIVRKWWSPLCSTEWSLTILGWLSEAMIWAYGRRKVERPEAAPPGLHSEEEQPAFREIRLASPNSRLLRRWAAIFRRPEVGTQRVALDAVQGAAFKGQRTSELRENGKERIAPPPPFGGFWACTKLTQAVAATTATSTRLRMRMRTPCFGS